MVTRAVRLSDTNSFLSKIFFFDDYILNRILLDLDSRKLIINLIKITTLFNANMFRHYCHRQCNCLQIRMCMNKLAYRKQEKLMVVL